MKVTELIGALQKAVQATGDGDVVLKHLEDGAETVLQSIGIHIGAGGDDPSSVVELEHGAAPAPAPTPVDAPAPPAA